MEYSKEFKEALSEFTAKEKDKLILRLLRKDRILSHRLYFELIDVETVDDKRNQMESLIQSEVSEAAKKYGSTKYFLPKIRKVSAQITEHVKITTDKFGEVSLSLVLIAEVLKNLPKSGNHYKLFIYLLNKLFRAFLLTKKLDADYFLELKADYDAVNELILLNKNLKEIALDNKLSFAWFDPENIPDNFDVVLKEIKAQGLLR